MSISHFGSSLIDSSRGPATTTNTPQSAAVSALNGSSSFVQAYDEDQGRSADTVKLGKPSVAVPPPSFEDVKRHLDRMKQRKSRQTKTSAIFAALKPLLPAATGLATAGAVAAKTVSLGALTGLAGPIGFFAGCGALFGGGIECLLPLTLEGKLYPASYGTLAATMGGLAAGLGAVILTAANGNLTTSLGFMAAGGAGALAAAMTNKALT